MALCYAAMIAFWQTDTNQNVPIQHPPKSLDWDVRMPGAREKGKGKPPTSVSPTMSHPTGLEHAAVSAQASHHSSG
jgi:hypothetical protein